MLVRKGHQFRPVSAMIGAALGAWGVCTFIRAVLIFREYPPQMSLKSIAGYLKTIAIFSAPDGATLAVALALGVGAALAVRRSRILLRAVGVVWGILIALVVLLSIVNAATVPIYRWPLTWQLLRYSRVLSDTAGLQYIASLTPRIVYVGILVGILLPLGGMAVVVRLPRAPARVLIIAATVFTAAAAVYGLKAARELARREDEYLFTNAAVAFALSTVTPPIERLAEQADSTRLPPEAKLTGVAPPLPAGRPKNLIFFAIESLGANYLREYGGPWNVMPNLRDELKHGMKINWAYAHAPSSTVALYSMLQSAVPLTLEATGKESSANSLIAVAHRNGLRTAFFASGVPYDDEIAYLRAAKIDKIQDSRQTPCNTTDSITAESVQVPIDNRCSLNALLDWIDTSPSPFFSILWNYQTHYPYYVNGGIRQFPLPKGISPRHARALNVYLNATEETDLVLGELLRQLRRRGLADDTLIVVLGDHGEAFGQHGVGGHGSDVHEESIRIPLAFLYPGFRSAEEYDGLVGEMDLPPTVAHLMGFQMPANWRGISLFSGERNRRLYHYAEGRDAMVGYREGDEKVILRMPQPALIDLLPWRHRPGATFERYDLRRDPGERSNLRIRGGAQSTLAMSRLSHWVADASRRQ